jgi:hypothetical protein
LRERLLKTPRFFAAKPDMHSEQSQLSGAGMSGYGAIAVADHSVSFAMTLAVFALFEFSQFAGGSLSVSDDTSI